MVTFQYRLIALFAAATHGYLLSDLSDYRDYDANCVAEYLQSHHGLNIAFKAKPQRHNYCGKYIKKFEDSFYDSVEDEVTRYPNKTCVINLLRLHNVSDVFFKALGYNYFQKQLVRFTTNETCDGLVDVLRIDNDCEYREMSVKFIGSDQSMWKLRPCLDDLFREFNVDEIVFVDQDSRIGFRRFGKHLKSFIEQLVMAGKAFCSESDLSLKYFHVERLVKENLLYNKTQLDCFKFFLINQNIFKSEIEGNGECNEIMRHQIEKVISIELFGFTKFSRNVKDCIIQHNKKNKLIEQVVVLPTIARFLKLSIGQFEIPREIYMQNSRNIIQNTLSCLKLF